MARASGAGRELGGDEYDIVAVRVSWGGLSITAFLVALFARQLLRFLPWRPESPYMWPLLWVLATAGFGLLGLLAAFLGLRFGRGRTAARWGLLLNGAVVGCVVLIVAAFVYIRYGPR